MLDAASLRTRIDTNTNSLEREIATLQNLAEELSVQLLLDPLTTSGVVHFFPAAKPAVISDEFIPDFPMYVFRVFYAACIEHLLKVLEVRVSTHEVIGE